MTNVLTGGWVVAMTGGAMMLILGFQTTVLGFGYLFRVNESILNDGAVVLMASFLILIGGAISRARPEMDSRWSITVIVMSVIGWLALVHVGQQFGMSIGLIGLSIGPLLALVGGIQEMVQSSRRKT
jgi:small basic protein